MNARLFIILFFTAIMGLLSCKDKDLVPPTPAKTTVNVSNATNGAIKYYVNGTRQNDVSAIYAGGSSGYLTVPGGTQNYQFNNANPDFSTLFTTTFTLDTSRFYTIFVCGAAADKAFRIDDPFIVADTIIANDTSSLKSVIRFVNTTADSSKYDFMVNKGDTVNLKNYKFKDASTFLSVNAGTKEIKVFVAGSSTPAIDISLTFSPHQIYTLFTRGSLTGSGTNVLSLCTFGVSLSN